MTIAKIAKIAKIATVKTASIKALKAKKVIAPVAVENIAPVASRAEMLLASFDAKLKTRVAALREHEINVPNEVSMVAKHFNPAGDSYRQFLIAVERTESIIDYTFFNDNFANYKTVKGNSDANYMQFKTVEKIIKLIKAFAFDEFSAFDGYTQNIMYNAMVNNGVLSARGAFASLVKVEFNALESQDEVLKMRSNSSPDTGGSQMSSTKELFRIIGLTNGIKGAKNAPIVLTDEAKEKLSAHFKIIADKSYGRRVPVAA